MSAKRDVDIYVGRAALLLLFRRWTHPGFNSGATPSLASLVTATAQHASNSGVVSTSV